MQGKLFHYKLLRNRLYLFVDKLCIETSCILFYTKIKEHKNAKLVNMIIG